MVKTSFLILFVILISVGVASALYLPSTLRDSPVIVAVGDIACSNDSDHRDTSDRCHELQTSNLALSVNPDAVFLLGDLQYFDGKYEDFLGSYDPTWGKMKSITYPSPGNHDYQSFDGAKGYFDYFGAAAGDPTKGYYSFDIGSWHIISLNSNCQEEDPEDPTKDKMVSCAKPPEQVEWLKNDLAADDSKCTLAFWHHPMFSSGGEGSHPTVGPFWDELYADKADVVLVGHDHNYERFLPQDPNATQVADGITQFVVGTGGWSLWNKYDEKENTAIFNATSYGILKLVLHDSSFDWEFIPEPGSQFTDKGTGLCN
jgi:hypothetical protein